ncbi:MAG: 16S rRNA (guanine(966)-N(2))-methyltransferase RsmD [Nitrospirae bacterium]|nr:16S rRNA (guanine(966)-N(2))-methyltransferase RsmD [Nitrospirota bacterium]
MRISSGELKGRKIGKKKLFAGRGGKDDLRPTSAKVREAIFDILRNNLAGASFLDLYAGSGTVGIEAASRGADRVIFVEAVRSRAKAIDEITGKLALTGRTRVYCERIEEFLKRSSRSGDRFDVIFADPPYDSEEIDKILPLIDEYGILNDQGAVLIEHTRKKKVPERIAALLLKKQYRYGDTMLALYRKS